MFSDFIFDKQPSNIKEAFENYEKISQNLGNNKNNFKYAGPMYAKLTPLKFVST